MQAGSAAGRNRLLEDQLRAQLEDTRIEGARHLPEIAAASGRSRDATSKVVAETSVLSGASKLRVIPSVEAFGTELEGGTASFADDEALKEREVPVVAAGTAHGIETNITPSPRRWNGVYRWVDPLNAGDNTSGTDLGLWILVGTGCFRAVAQIAAWKDAGNVGSVDSEVIRLP